MSRHFCVATILVAGLTVAGALNADRSSSQDKPPPAAGEKQPAPPAGKAPPAAQYDAASAEQAIEKKLDEITDLDFSETPLREVLDRLSQKHKLQMIPDPKKLEEANVALDTPVTRSLKGLKLRHALNLVLRDLGLAWMVRNEVLAITSRDEADTQLVIKTYAVGDLVRLRAKEHDDESEYDAFQDVLTNAIAPDSWKEAGGPGSCEFTRGVMVVGQTPGNHERIARFLAVLRQARRQVTEFKGDARLAVIDGEDDAELAAKIRTQLRRTVTIDWLEKPLKECLTVLRSDYGLPVEVSVKKLEEANVTLDTPVTLKLSAVSLPAALDHLTQRLGLSWLLRDGVLLITSKDEADTYLTTRIYPIPDLLPQNDQGGDVPLYDVVTGTVRPDSWREAGGPGVLLRCDALGYFVCRQTREPQEEIEKLLTSLRRDIAASSGAPRGAREMSLQVYRIGDPPVAATRPTVEAPVGGQKPAAAAGDGQAKKPAKPEGPSPEAVAKIVRDLVAPESWEAPGSKAYLRSLGDRLIVRQTPKVHREIRALLEKLGVLADGSPAGGGFF